MLACAVLAGCASYEPAPLDTEAHLKQWRNRDPGDPSVADYARELNERDTAERGRFDIRDGITLPEAEVLALFFNPDLRTARLEAGVELAGAREAGRWQDPEFHVDGAWVLGNVDHPFIVGGGIGFTIPLSGRPGVEQDLAYARYGASYRRVVMAEWETVTKLRAEWLKFARAREEVTLVESLIDDVRGVQEVADTLAEAGELTVLDTRVFELEIATRRLALMRLNNAEAGAQLRLRELMGLHPDAPVNLRPTMRSTAALPAGPESRLVENNPLLELRRAEYETAEQQLRLEVRKQYPDLSIGPSYEFEGGHSRIGLGFGLPIPIINLNKEGIARARARREAVAARYHAELEGLVHRLRRVETNLESAREQRAFIEDSIVPLADAQIKDARTLAGLGEFDALTQLDALTRRHDARVQVLEAALAQFLAREELIALMGPTFKPRPQEPLDE